MTGLGRYLPLSHFGQGLHVQCLTGQGQGCAAPGRYIQDLHVQFLGHLRVVWEGAGICIGEDHQFKGVDAACF